MTGLEVRDLTVEYNSGGILVRPLVNRSMDAGDGQLVVLLGPSGCGKTTLLSCIAGLLTPTSGSIRVGGTEVVGLDGAAMARYRQEKVGIVFQAFNLLPSLTAHGNVVAPMALAGVPRADASARADLLLERVGLADRKHHRPSAMSGGQQQRVAIARALVHDPPIVLADEPTAHLDHVQVEGVLQLMRELASPGRTLLAATHDDRVTDIADAVIELVPPAESAANGIEREPEEVQLAAAEVLFRQGDPADLVYLVKSGRVEIFRELADGHEDRVTVVGPGQYFGELGPILRLPRSASARALGPTEVVGYTVRRFRYEHPGLAAGLGGWARAHRHTVASGESQVR
ncbi:MAG: ATP-binding cassette domain-containing protein [Marmoricola sp.]